MPLDASAEILATLTPAELAELKASALAMAPRWTRLKLEHVDWRSSIMLQSLLTEEIERRRRAAESDHA